jgi:hypothetical protein
MKYLQNHQYVQIICKKSHSMWQKCDTNHECGGKSVDIVNNYRCFKIKITEKCTTLSSQQSAART